MRFIILVQGHAYSTSVSRIVYSLRYYRLLHSLSCLSVWVGFSGSVLKWFGSYLQDHFQSVKNGSAVSNLFKLKLGFPQGSVLGPSPLSKVSKVVWIIAILYFVVCHPIILQGSSTFKMLLYGFSLVLLSSLTSHPARKHFIGYLLDKKFS